MKFDISCLQPKEQASFALRALYEAAGCRKYHMGRFEEYGLYQENRSFLSSEQVITFTDLDGRLLALKPDVTLSIAKTAQPAPADYQDDPSRPVRVATKFVNIAKSYYASIGRDIDIIKLNGSIELASILGLSDVIVDIVETGTTLRENGLRVVTEFMPISARFIANKASYQFKHREMDEMLEKLRAALAAKEEKK